MACPSSRPEKPENVSQLTELVLQSSFVTPVQLRRSASSDGPGVNGYAAMTVSRSMPPGAIEPQMATVRGAAVLLPMVV